MSITELYSTRSILARLAFYVLTASEVFAASAPTTVSQLALYQGADREKILIEGAKKEGQLTFYNSHTWFRTFVKDFEKKYPFIKVSEWRNDSKNVLRRMLEEAKSTRSLVDVVETTPDDHGGIEAGRLAARILLARGGLLSRRTETQGEKRIFLFTGPGDLQQLGIQHRTHSVGCGAAKPQGPTRSKVEG